MMKIKVFIMVTALLFFSCTLGTETYNYLQEVHIDGPINKSTIKISDRTIPQKTVMRSMLSLSRLDRIEANTGTQYTKNNFEYISTNLFWNLAKTQLTAEIESRRKHFAFLFGINYFHAASFNSLGAKGGIAYVCDYKGWAWRADFILHMIDMKYDVILVQRKVTTYIGEWGLPDSRTTIDTHYANGSGIFLNPELALTLNTNKSTFPINFFANYTHNYQKLFKFNGKNSNNESVINKIACQSISVGMFNKISQKGRIIAGLRYNYPPFEDGTSGYWDIIIQYDILKF